MGKMSEIHVTIQEFIYGKGLDFERMTDDQILGEVMVGIMDGELDDSVANALGLDVYHF